MDRFFRPAPEESKLNITCTVSMSRSDTQKMRTDEEVLNKEMLHQDQVPAGGPVPAPRPGPKLNPTQGPVPMPRSDADPEEGEAFPPKEECPAVLRHQRRRTAQKEKKKEEAMRKKHEEEMEVMRKKHEEEKEIMRKDEEKLLEESDSDSSSEEEIFNVMAECEVVNEVPETVKVEISGQLHMYHYYPDVREDEEEYEGNDDEGEEYEEQVGYEGLDAEMFNHGYDTDAEVIHHGYDADAEMVNYGYGPEELEESDED